MKVVVVAAGHTHTMVCTDEGEVFSFGHGLEGALGHGTCADEHVPRVVDFLSINADNCETENEEDEEDEENEEDDY